MNTVRTVAVLGAGCAGTLLSLELLRQRFAGRIILVDARSTFEREQRWCFWRSRQEHHADVPVDHEWAGWKLRGPGGDEIVRSSKRYVYSQVHAPAFFRRNHGRLADDRRVDLHLDCRVTGVHRRDGGYRIATARGDLEADEIIDARHEGTAAYVRQVADDRVPVWQSFLGRVGEFSAPRTDPRTATLMDFRVACPEGLAFGYILPYGRARALVEVAVLAARPVPTVRLEHLLGEYLDGCGGGSFETAGIEQGVLPMTTVDFASKNRPGPANIGVGGGSARPSSGYAFANILRDTPALARAICRHRRPAPPRLAWKYRAMDAVFLRLLREKPALARQAFLTMFERVSPDRLIRFLTGTSSLADDLGLGWKMPRGEFLRAALPSQNGLSVQTPAAWVSSTST